MTAYDKTVHLIGLISIGVLGLSASPAIYAHFPWWLIAVASITAGVAQASTMPIVNRPIAIANTAVTNATAARNTGTTPAVTP